MRMSECWRVRKPPFFSDVPCIAAEEYSSGKLRCGVPRLCSLHSSAPFPVGSIRTLTKGDVRACHAAREAPKFSDRFPCCQDAVAAAVAPDGRENRDKDGRVGGMWLGISRTRCSYITPRSPEALPQHHWYGEEGPLHWHTLSRFGDPFSCYSPRRHTQ